jgi:hypothetical protein
MKYWFEMCVIGYTRRKRKGERERKHTQTDVSETGFCVRLHVKSTQMGPIETDSLCLRSGGDIVSLTRRPNFIPQEDACISFLLEAGSTPEKE